MLTTKSDHSSFESAMRLGFWKRLRRKLHRQPTQLVNFEAVWDSFKSFDQTDMGIQPIPIHNIVGSVGRFNEFDRDYMPINDHIENKWQHIFKLLIHGIDLPPIDVYQLDSDFYVIDGNHRVSVNRFLGIQYVDAHIIEIRITEPCKS